MTKQGRSEVSNVKRRSHDPQNDMVHANRKRSLTTSSTSSANHYLLFTLLATNIIQRLHSFPRPLLLLIFALFFPPSPLALETPTNRQQTNKHPKPFSDIGMKQKNQSIKLFLVVILACNSFIHSFIGLLSHTKREIERDKSLFLSSFFGFSLT